MAINFPGPGELRIFYTTNESAVIASHVLRHSFKFTTDPPTLGLNFASYDADMRGGSTVDMENWTDAFVAMMQPFYASAVDITHAEIWYYDSGTFDSIFVSSYPIGVNGTNGGSTVDFSQMIITFRSQFGSIAKLDFRGTCFASSAKQGFPTATSSINALATAVTSGLSIMIARDDGFIFTPIMVFPGQNERAFKKVLR